MTIDGNIICEHCILRIIKEAYDWSEGNITFLFWSCADVLLIDEEAGAGYCFIHLLWKRSQAGFYKTRSKIILEGRAFLGNAASRFQKEQPIKTTSKKNL